MVFRILRKIVRHWVSLHGEIQYLKGQIKERDQIIELFVRGQLKWKE